MQFDNTWAVREDFEIFQKPGNVPNGPNDIVFRILDHGAEYLFCEFK